MATIGTRSNSTVADHYDHLDPFYRAVWGEHVHHGLWTNPEFTPEEAVRHLVREVARDVNLEAGSRICDIGCGYGAPARLWAEEYGAEVTGFTVSAAQHAYARQQSVEGPQPDLRLQNFLANNLPGGQMDAVVAIESLTHIEDQPLVVQEGARLLRPDGRLVMCVWMAHPSAPKWARRHLLDPICEEGRLSGLPTASDLHAWVRSAGLRVAELDDVTPFVRRTWTVVLRRFFRMLVTDPTLFRTLVTSTMPDRVFARTLVRVWLAQYIGVLRYGWLVAVRE